MAQAPRGHDKGGRKAERGSRPECSVRSKCNWVWVQVTGQPCPMGRLEAVEARLLGKENLAPPSRGRPTDMTMYGISDSNMSFSTRKYMEKFNLQS